MVAKKKSFTKWITTFVLIAIAAILVFAKIFNPGFPLAWLIVLMVILTIIGVIVWKVPHLFSFNPSVDKDALPEPLTLFQCRALADEAIKSPYFYDYMEDPEYEKTPSYGDGQFKQAIYVFKFKGRFKDKTTNERNTYAILINQHYPNKRAILKNPKDHEINREANDLATRPEKAANVITIKEENPLLGTSKTTEQIIHPEAKEEKKEEIVET